MKPLEKPAEQDVFQKISDHEQVIFCNDPASGLQAIIAIHDTTLGPGMGGTRMYPYETVDAALEDVLRLSEGMTDKCAAADVDFGGGKGVIIGDPETDKSSAMFRAYGRYVDSLNGRFYTGTDMGTTMEDFVMASKETNFINGLPEVFGGGGDSSIPTSKGVLYGLKATNQYLFGSDELGGKTYAIQGLGKVGLKVAEQLIEAGGYLYVNDINEDALDAIKNQADDKNGYVKVVGKDDIHRTEADIFVPCAMGGIINDRTVLDIRARAIVGSANNQLADERYAQELKDKNVLLAPDYMVNAGGLIQVTDELYGPNKERVLMKTRTIYDALLEIYRQSAINDITTTSAARWKCENRLREQRQLNNFYVRHRSPKWNIKE